MTPVLVHLLKGILYRDSHPQLWQQLERQQGPVRDYLDVLGLDLYLDDGEGYAFLRQRVAAEDEPEIPRLIQRRPLSYPVSLLCVLLRKRLAEADHSGDDLKVVVHRDELLNDMRVYLPSQANEVRLTGQVESAITKVVELGFLKKLKDAHHYEIRRILKALVDADWLADLQQKLQLYADHAASLEAKDAKDAK